MKRILILICLILLVTASPMQTAYALAPHELARPIDRESYFFSEKDLSTALFAVPYTYCVEVLRDEGDWLYVSYAEDEGDYKKLFGYCKSEQFERVPSPPQNTYLNKTVTVTFSANAGEGAFNPPADMQVEAVYYGGYRHGANFYSYVLCRGSFCYIEGANDDYPLNVYEEQSEQPGDKKGTQTEGAAGTTGLVIFIVILAVALVVIIALAFSPKRRGN